MSPVAVSPSLPTAAERSIARRLRDNLLSTFAAQIFEKVVALASAVYLARVIGPAGVGVLGLAVAISSYVGFLVNAGLDVQGARWVAQRPQDLGRYVGEVIALRARLAVIAFAFLVLAIHFLPKPPYVKATALIAGGVLFAQAINLDWVFQGLERMHLIAIRRVATQLMNLAGVLILVHKPSDVAIAAVPPVVAALLNGWWMLVAVRRIQSIRVHITARAGWILFRAAFPVLLSVLMIQFYLQFDVFWISVTRTDTETGLYGAAQKIAGALTTIQLLVSQSVYPILCKLGASGAKDLRVFLEQTTLVMCRVSLVAGGAVIFAAPWLTRLLFGSAFDPTARLLEVLAISQMLVFNESVIAPSLYAVGRNRQYLGAVFSGAILNMVLNLTLVRLYGPIASAWIMIATEVTVFTILLFHAWRAAKFRTRQFLLLPIGVVAAILYLLYRPAISFPAVVWAILGALGCVLLAPVPGAIRQLRTLGPA